MIKYRKEWELLKTFCYRRMSKMYCLAYTEVMFRCSTIHDREDPEDRSGILFKDRFADVVFLNPLNGKTLAYELKIKDYKGVLQQAIEAKEGFTFSGIVMPTYILDKHFNKIKNKVKKENIEVVGVEPVCPTKPVKPAIPNIKFYSRLNTKKPGTFGIEKNKKFEFKNYRFKALQSGVIYYPPEIWMHKFNMDSALVENCTDKEAYL